jgi:hypothetical protein
MARSQDSLDEDAGTELDVIVMAADEREIQHSRYPLAGLEPNVRWGGRSMGRSSTCSQYCVARIR